MGGEMCCTMMCSEWIVGRAASEGGDEGGKVWGRQKSVVMMRRKKERSKIASPCKNVYLNVVPVHCCVVFPHPCGSVSV